MWKKAFSGCRWLPCTVDGGGKHTAILFPYNKKRIVNADEREDFTDTVIANIQDILFIIEMQLKFFSCMCFAFQMQVCSPGALVLGLLSSHCFWAYVAPVYYKGSYFYMGVEL